MHATSVSIDDMRDQLHSLDWARQQLAQTEPLASVPFTTGGAISLHIEEADNGGKAWHDRDLGAPAPAWLELSGGERYALTRQAVRELASTCRIPQKLQEEIPAWLLETNCNWHLHDGLGERELQLLTSGTAAYPGPADGLGTLPLARAQCRATIEPFSNLGLMDTILEGFEKKYGPGEVLVDYKFHHDLEKTAMRLIVPGQQRVISGTSVADDTWSAGIQLKNSLIGLKQTEIDGYLFRWWCTNGCTDTLASTGAFSRRGSTETDALLWAAETVEEVLGGLEHTLDDVQELAAIPVAGDATAVLGDLFARHGLAGREQRRIIETMADDEEMTMYSLMQATTQAANEPGLNPSAVQALMDMGGHIVRSAATGRCDSCRRILPDE